MALANKKVRNVSAQRERVQTLIRTAQATEAALIAAESALDVLDSGVSLYSGK